jgi:hypothetical protein
VIYESYLEELREVIRRLHGVDSEHVRTVAVKETLEGKTLWDGLVEIFALQGHPTAARAYAWADGPDDPQYPHRHVVVLDLHAKSAHDAVRSAIMQPSRNLQPTQQESENVKTEASEAEAMDQIVPVRFKAEELRAMETAAKARNQTISEWVRSTIDATLNL